MREVLSPWRTRYQGQGSGRVHDVRITPEGAELHRDDGVIFKYKELGNRLAWVPSHGGWIGRTTLEEELDVFPGYADGVEDAYGALRMAYAEVMAERHALQREFAERFDRLHAELEKQFENAEAARFATRHPKLSLWRSKNPTPTEQIPEPLRTVGAVKRMDTDQPCVVYFLLHQEEVVYVGQTTMAWPGRIEQHLKERAKVFDDVWYLECDRDSLDAVEQAMIKRFQPKYNIAGNRKKSA